MDMLKKRLQAIFRPGSTLHSISLLAGSTALAQIVNVACMPLLTRLYSPADFGVMALFSSVISIASVFSGLRYYLAVPLPRLERHANALVYVSMLTQVFCLLLLALLFWGSTPFLDATKLTILLPWRWLLLWGVAAQGLYTLFVQWAIRQGSFGLIARSRVSQIFSGVSLKLCLGWFGFRPLGLLLGTIFAYGGGILPLIQRFRKQHAARPTIQELKRVALVYRRFPQYSTWAGLMNSMGMNLLPILLTTFFTPKVAGSFVVAQQLLQMPAVFIGQAVSQVFIQQAVKARDDGNLSSVVWEHCELLIRLGVFPIIVIGMISPLILPLLLGEQWYDAGLMARAIAPWIALAFVYSPMSVLFTVLQLQQAGLVFEGGYILARFSAAFAMALMRNPIGVAWAYSVVGGLFLTGCLLFLLKRSGISVSFLCHTSVRLLFQTVVAIFPLGLALHLDSGNIIIAVIGTGLSVMLWLLLNGAAFSRLMRKVGE